MKGIYYTAILITLLIGNAFSQENEEFASTILNNPKDVIEILKNSNKISENLKKDILKEDSCLSCVKAVEKIFRYWFIPTECKLLKNIFIKAADEDGNIRDYQKLMYINTRQRIFMFAFVKEGDKWLLDYFFFPYPGYYKIDYGLKCKEE